MKIFSIDHMNVSIGDKILLKDVSFEVKKGEVVHILGKNGSGKSSLLNSIVAHIDKKIQFSFLPQVAGQFTKIHFKLKDICAKEYPFYSEKNFEKSWHESSGGERQRALISKTLVEGKDLILLDEPFNHLDQESCQLVVKVINREISKGSSLIYTGHQSMFESERKIEVERWR